MSVPTFPLSFKGTQFICELEAFESKPYKDPGGDGNWVIGYGTEINDIDAAKYKNGISKETGLFLFSKHNETLLKQLAKCPLGYLQQWQKDAVVSLSYNIGFGEGTPDKGFINSTIYKHLLNQDPDVSPWLWFNKGADEQVMNGLKRRRWLEQRLFIYGNYSTTD